MKFLLQSISEKKVPIPSSSFREWHSLNDGNYWCKNCGSPDSFRVWYSEVGYGIARVATADGDLEDYETTDFDNFEVNRYKCQECEIEGMMLDRLVTEDAERGYSAYREYQGIEEVDEYEEEEEEEDE